MMFDHVYAAIAKSMPQLVALCEGHEARSQTQWR